MARKSIISPFPLLGRRQLVTGIQKDVLEADVGHPGPRNFIDLFFHSKTDWLTKIAKKTLPVNGKCLFQIIKAT
jgi:hypothetical protein